MICEICGGAETTEENILYDHHLHICGSCLQDRQQPESSGGMELDKDRG